MQGTVKWFDRNKGYGFITDSDGNDIFVYQNNIRMKGFRALSSDDIVAFSIGKGNENKKQAVNVKPILTQKMIKDSLFNEHLYLKVSRENDKNKYAVVNKNEVIQKGCKDLSFLEVAAYAGFDIEGLGKEQK